MVSKCIRELEVIFFEADLKFLSIGTHLTYQIADVGQSAAHFIHTTPVNDQLPLLIGQLEKQSGRSIARICGEKKLCVVWWRCCCHTVK